jgi:hypothetical protein
MASPSVREGQAATLYATCPVRVIHTDVELYRPVLVRRSARVVPRWRPPADVDVLFLQRVVAGLRRL